MNRDEYREEWFELTNDFRQAAIRRPAKCSARTGWFELADQARRFR